MPNPNDQAARASSRRQRLARMRDLMVSASDISEPVAFFRDHLAVDPVFCARSVPGDPGLDPVLQAIAVAMHGPSGSLGERSFCCHGPLWHGRCDFPSGEAMVLYHSAIDVGIIDLPIEGGRAFLRFSTLSWKMWPATRPSG